MAEGAANGRGGPSRRGLSIGVITAIVAAVGVGVAVSRRSDDGEVRTADSSIQSIPLSTTIALVDPPVSSAATVSPAVPLPTTTLPVPPSYPDMPEVDLARIGTATPEECQPELFAPTTAAPATATVGTMPAPVTAARAANGPPPSVAPVFDDPSARASMVTAYGCAHLDAFSGLRMSGRVVEISLTNDVAGHQVALDQQFGPGEVRAVLGDVLLATRAKVREDLMPLFDQRDRSGASPINGLGDDSHRLGVELAAGQAKLAATLAATYGKAVHITVGLLHWSVNGPVYGRAITCQATGGPMAGSRGQVHGVAITVAPLDAVRSGAQFIGNVEIRNDTTTPISIGADPGYLVAPVHSIGGSTPIAISEMPIAAVLVMPTPMASGASATFDVRGGTASCDPAHGYALAPGDYETVIPVPITVDGAITIVEVRAPLKITT